jgi:hypothetical protein
VVRHGYRAKLADQPRLVAHSALVGAGCGWSGGLLRGARCAGIPA